MRQRKVQRVNNEQKEKIKELGLIATGQCSRKMWLGIIVLVLLIVGVGWYWLGTSKEVEMRYKTAPVKRMDLALTVSATGNVTPKDQVEVSSELSGILEDVYVDFNDK